MDQTRIEELRRATYYGWPGTAAELLYILRCTEALGRLETWLRADHLRYVRDIDQDAEGRILVRLIGRDPAELTGVGVDLPSAILVALVKPAE